jgi:uncharacterized protein (DUF362 family)
MNWRLPNFHENNEDKDHFISGVSLSLKNHYGSINDPETMHDNNCDPYIAEINSLAQVKEKTRLIVLDASVGIFSGDPMGQPQLRYNSLIVGQDPVALDYQCLQIINEQRELRELPPVDKWTSPKHIETAAGLGLGTMNPDEMEIIRLNVKDVDAKGKRPFTWGEMKTGDS